MASLFPVAGDEMPAAFVLLVGDAAHGRFCWPQKAFSPRRFLVDSFSCWPPSLIPNQQGTLIRVALWRHVDIASALFSWLHLKRALVSLQRPSWQPNRFIFTLFGWRCGVRVHPLVGAHQALARPLTVAFRLHSQPRLAPRAPNASGLAAMALSALPACSTPAVPSTRVGAAPTTGNAPPRPPLFCASTLARY